MSSLGHGRYSPARRTPTSNRRFQSQQRGGHSGKRRLRDSGRGGDQLQVCGCGGRHRLQLSGGSGHLTQADLLNVLGNAATARSDTFSIRSYGEARDATGQVTASAICEAVVQRLPDWFDPADPAETAPASLTSESNKTLGRRFRLVAFR